MAARAVEPERPFRVDIGERPVVVTGDGHRLRQVVDNLLANVREHTTPATTVTVTLGVDPTAATVVVADDGPGMTTEAASRVFDRFWQAEPTHRGTGLGLSIVAEIVAAHGGTIDLATAPGEGARFTVVLPLDVPAFPASSQEGAVALPG